MRILTISALIFLISIHCGVLAYPTETDLTLSDDDLEAISINSTDNALVERQLAIDMLPISRDCKTVIKKSIPVAKAAFTWTKKKVCEDYECKPEFAPVYKKYAFDLIKKHFILEWIFRFFEKKGHPIQKYGMNPGKIFDSVVKKCIESDKDIMGIKDICHTSQDAFQDIKSCVIGEVIPYVPKVAPWAEKACKIALKEDLVHKIVKPVFKPNWRKMVTDFNKSPLC